MTMAKARAAQNGRAVNLDLDAKRAARQAAVNDAERYRFRFGGQDWALRPANEWPANAKAMMADGDVFEVIESILEGDATAFWAIRPRPTVQDVTDIIEAWSEWSGTGDLPNSPSSPQPASTQT